ncbi:DUF262 domain-containing protein [Yersinia enterocolitica]|uniref:DUF262 domain-containing protein n=1 Tax=Yersinia enterocolitica TaxID=630 RepID=UPI0028BAB8A2|nr:DUF262 domain-containing protein [Yersinia enterocolitica]
MNVVEQIDVESRPIKWLIDGMKCGNINIDNSFQRRYVWITPDKISLIETILMGFPIPEIYLWQNETDPNSGDTKHAIVDGQQRLGAVLSFINDEFKLNKSALELKNEDFVGKTFSELTPEQKSDIWKYKFSIRFIKEVVKKEQITKLFLRLNSTNTTLNPQELRNAEFNGEFIKLADFISTNPFWTKYSLFSNADLRRMQDIQFISTILIFIRMGIEEETTQSAINKAYDQFNEEYPEAGKDLSVFEDIIAVLDKLLENAEHTKEIAKKKTHLYSLFILSYYLSTTKHDAKNEYHIVAEKINDWYEHYSSEREFSNEQFNQLLSEYRTLSQEGVQKKPNRMRRFEILKMYIKI